MNFFKSIDKEKLISLATGIAGIYFCYFIGGILHEHILKRKYQNRFTGQQNYFKLASGLVAVEKLVIWVFGSLYNKYTLPKQKIITLPLKNNLLCAFTTFASSLTNNYAMIFVSYPIIMMFKSCNILSVILIALLCSRVKQKRLRLGGKKLVVALFVSIGIILFKIFDPQSKAQDQKKTQLLGLFLLFLSLLADGFLPDFQAEIKSNYKPEPTVMMTEINKWCFFISLLSLIVSGQFFLFIDFMWCYPIYDIHMFVMTSLAFIGHIFIYNMIKNFKQHIVPFVITTRKIISVGLSMIFYHHQTSFMQILGLFIVFGTTLYQFVSEVSKPEPKSQERVSLNSAERKPSDQQFIADQNEQKKGAKTVQLMQQQMNDEIGQHQHSKQTR